MPWIPTPGGPKNLRELYHWVWNNLVDAGENITGGGGDITHVSTTGRSDPDQHPTSAITNLDADQAAQDSRLTDIEAEQVVQNDDIDTRVIAGYGGIQLDVPVGGAIELAWTTLPADNPSYVTPVDVAQEFVTNSLEFQGVGEWIVNVYFSIAHNESNGGRIFYVRMFNATDNVAVGPGTEVFVARNQPGTVFSVAFSANISPAFVGDRFQIQVGASPDTFTNVVFSDFKYLANRISAGSTTGGGPAPPEGPADPYYTEVISLLNFADMPDGTAITDTISGNTWTAVNGASIISGELVLDGTDDYVQHTDSIGFRYEFNGNLSGYWTLEIKVTPNVVSQPEPMLLLDWRSDNLNRGMSLQIATDNTFKFRVGDNTIGWDVDLISTTLAAPAIEFEICIGRGRSGYVMFINGKFEATAQFSGLLNVGSDGLRLGRGITGSQPYNGTYQRARFTRKTTRYIANDYTPEAGNSYAYP